MVRNVYFNCMFIADGIVILFLGYSSDQVLPHIEPFSYRHFSNYNCSGDYQMVSDSKHSAIFVFWIHL